MDIPFITSEDVGDAFSTDIDNLRSALTWSLNYGAGLFAGHASGLSYLGYAAMNIRDFEKAKACFEEILAVARQENSGHALVATLSNLGMIAGEVNDIETAQFYLEKRLQ